MLSALFGAISPSGERPLCSGVSNFVLSAASSAFISSTASSSTCSCSAISAAFLRVTRPMSMSLLQVWWVCGLDAIGGGIVLCNVKCEWRPNLAGREDANAVVQRANSRCEVGGIRTKEERGKQWAFRLHDRQEQPRLRASLVPAGNISAQGHTRSLPSASTIHQAMCSVDCLQKGERSAIPGSSQSLSRSQLS